jgi:hypothetical protein
MLTVDPNKRSSMNDIINHKWLKIDDDMLSNDFGILNERELIDSLRIR